MKLEDISKHFTHDDKGSLHVSQVSVDDIVEQTGSPVFIYDAQTIIDTYTYLREHLPEQVDIFYATKANPHLAVMTLLKGLGAGMEVASHGELIRCEKIGADPQNIVFAGPSKTNADITKAVEMGIYSINAESLGELGRINEIALAHGKKMPVELRVNPQFEVAGAAVNMGGGSKKFGIDSEQIYGVITQVQKNMPGVELHGLHIYAGTGITEQEGFLKNMANVFEQAQIMNRQFPIKSIDIGGGLGIPYSDGDKPLSIDGISERMNQLFEQYSFIRENDARIIIEPGRYIVGQSGIYVSTIEDLKHSRGKDYVLVDGGVHHLLRPPLIGGGGHPVMNISQLGESLDSVADVGGSLCTSIDFLGYDIKLPGSTARDDLIGTFCSGAYGYTESMPWFLSHDVPAEVLVNNGSFDIITPPIKVEEYISNQVVPNYLL